MGEVTDIYTNITWEPYAMQLPSGEVQVYFTDSDPDLESGFFILRHTLSPCVLTENLFMTNIDDYRFLMSEPGMEAITKLHVEGIEEYVKELG